MIEAPITTDIMRVPAQARYDTFRKTVRETAHMYGDGAAGQAVAGFGNDIAKIIAAKTPVVATESLHDALQKQAELHRHKQPEFSESVYTFTDNARALFPNNIYVGVLGLVQDFSRFVQAPTIDEQREFQQKYTETYATLLAKGTTEVKAIVKDFSTAVKDYLPNF